MGLPSNLATDTLFSMIKKKHGPSPCQNPSNPSNLKKKTGFPPIYPLWHVWRPLRFPCFLGCFNLRFGWDKRDNKEISKTKSQTSAERVVPMTTLHKDRKVYIPPMEKRWKNPSKQTGSTPNHWPLLLRGFLVIPRMIGFWVIRDFCFWFCFRCYFSPHFDKDPLQGSAGKSHSLQMKWCPFNHLPLIWL